MTSLERRKVYCPEGEDRRTPIGAPAGTRRWWDRLRMLIAAEMGQRKVPLARRNFRIVKLLYSCRNGNERAMPLHARDGERPGEETGFGGQSRER